MTARKSKLLGMSFSTARGRLNKMILFQLVKETGKDVCFRCGEKINDIDDLTIDHKEPWIKNGTSFFWDLNNISFSHFLCNTRAAEKQIGKHPSQQSYKNGCRCDGCKNIEKIRRRIQRSKGIKT